MRQWLAVQLIWLGMQVLDPATRKLVMMILQYHQPGALTDDEKVTVEQMAARWRQKEAAAR